jgi:hypothetical protein
MWVYALLGLIGFISSLWISSLIEMLYVPSPPLVALHYFGQNGPQVHPHTESVFVLTDESVFILQAEVDSVFNQSSIRLYEQSLRSLVWSNSTTDWGFLWDLTLPGQLYLGTSSSNSSELVLAYALTDGSTVLNYWPDMRRTTNSSIALKSRVTALSPSNSTVIYSLFNDSSIFHTLHYSPADGLRHQSATRKTGDFKRQEVTGGILTSSYGLTWATMVTYASNNTPDSTSRHLEFYYLNDTDWTLYGTYRLSHDIFVGFNQYYHLTSDALMSMPRFAVRKAGSELLIGHFGRLLSAIKWSTTTVELYFLDTFSVSDFRYVSCTDDYVLLVETT